MPVLYSWHFEHEGGAIHWMFYLESIKSAMLASVEISKAGLTEGCKLINSVFHYISDGLCNSFYGPQSLCKGTFSFKELKRVWLPRLHRGQQRGTIFLCIIEADSRSFRVKALTNNSKRLSSLGSTVTSLQEAKNLKHLTWCNHL